ncbi:TfoX/Sxy family DNA transformation protein [Hyunsoonleella rubra]|uniref:TfoX/Sxy family DNA transformation protein n=1 Tax=Hyunsoonleella rubra TaxID=1737062 RepID=A0ABW5TBC7_9FLAO
METTIALKGSKNIGVTIEKRLNEIGIYTLTDLAERTPEKAYRGIGKNYPDKTIPKCYYLYSLKGALLDIDWRKLPENIKKELRT